MLLSIDSASSGLENFQQEINVIANNIANVNTNGYKEADINFEDTLSDTIGSSAAGTNQVGTGVATSSITNDFSAGSYNNTGVPTDLAISGNGFFVVNDSAGNSFYTQDGHFSLNAAGNLETSNGDLLQGASGAITLASTNTSATLSGFSISTGGLITATFSDGSTATAQLALQNFSNPQELVKTGDNLYSATAAAGPLSAAADPGTSGLGTVMSGYLEMSNVDLASQLTNLITAQQAYSANSKVIATSDTILQTVINMVQG